MLAKLAILIVVMGSFLPLVTTVGGVTIYSYDLGIFLYIFALIFIRGKVRVGTIFPHDKLFAVFFIIVTLSSMMSIDRGSSFVYLALLCRISVIYILTRLYLRLEIVTFDYLGKVVFGSFIVLVLSGYVELLTGVKYFQISQYFGVTGVEEFESLIGRLSGTARNSNVYGIWLSMINIAVCSYFIAKGKGKNSIVIQMFVFPLLLATLSRSALICYFSGLLSIMWLWSSVGNRTNKFFKSMNSVLLVMSLILLYTMVSESGQEVYEKILGRFDHNFDKALVGESARLVQYESFFALVFADPIRYLFVGHGYGVFYETYLSYGFNPTISMYLKSGGFNPAGIHNILMKHIVSFGFIVSLGLTTVYIGMIRRCVHYYRISKNHIPLALASILIALVVPSQLNTVLTSAFMLPLLALIFASVAEMDKQFKEFK